MNPYSIYSGHDDEAEQVTRPFDPESLWEARQLAWKALKAKYGHLFYEKEVTPERTTITVMRQHQYVIDHVEKRAYLEVLGNETYARYRAFPLLDKASKNAERVDFASLFHNEVKTELAAALVALKVTGTWSVSGKHAERKAFNKAARIIQNTFFGYSFRKLNHKLNAAVWYSLDSEVAKLAIACQGHGANSTDYNLVAQNLEAVQEARRIMPGVLYFWLEYAKQTMQNACVWNESWALPAEGRFQTQGVAQEVREYIQSSVIHGDPFLMEHERLTPPESLSPAGWRYLIGLNTAWTRLLRGSDLPNVLNALAAVGAKPTHTTFKHFVRQHMNWRANNDHPIRQYPWVIRTAFEASKKGGKDFFHREMHLVMDWLRMGRPQFDKNQKKMSWESIMRKQHEWHEQRAIEEAQRQAELAVRWGRTPPKSRFFTWESLVGETAIGKYTVVPLTDSKQLYDEGQAMHHCVSGYDGFCNQGRSRIFGIREGDKPVATIELTWDANREAWFEGQNRGPCNMQVSSGVAQVGKEILKLYNRAQRKLDKAKQLEGIKEETSVVPAMPAPEPVEPLPELQPQVYAFDF